MWALTFGVYAQNCGYIFLPQFSNNKTQVEWKLPYGNKKSRDSTP